MVSFINRHYKLLLIAIPVLSLVMHFHVFKLDLIGIHVWRQTETQTVINNFATEDFNIFHPRINDHADTNRIMRMEFPLMQWLFAIFYKIFGKHIIISRMLTFIIGLCSAYGLYSLCHSIFKDKAVGVIAAWAFTFSPVFYYYTLNPMPDNMALCCAIWSIAFFCQYISSGKLTQLLWSSILLSVATLTKLPFILYGSFIFVSLIIKFRKKEISLKQLLSGIAIYTVIILPAIAWYVSVIPDWQGNAVISGMLNNKQSALRLLDILQGNLFSNLPELLINYGAVLFFIAGFYFLFRHKKSKNKMLLAYILWGVSIILYFLFEMNAIETVHDYYLFPFLPLIFLLVAYGAYKLLSAGNRFLYFLSVFCLAILPFTAFLRADSRWNTQSPGFNVTYYDNKEVLQNLTPKDAYCIAGDDDSHYILLYYINRKGWAFDNDMMDEPLLKKYISKGAKYIFSDSHTNTDSAIRSHFKEEIFSKNDLQVYELK